MTAQSLSSLAVLLGATLRGAQHSDIRVARLAAPAAAGPSDLSFYLPRWHDVAALADCRAAAVILAHDTHIHDDRPCQLRVDDVVAGIARAAAWVEPIRTRQARDGGSNVVDGTARIDASAIVGANVRIGAGTQIGPGVVIESGAVIGHHVRIDAGALIAGAVSIGDRVRVGAGCVIGTDGFSYLPSGRGWLRVPGFGGVEVADNVELLARVVIHAGVFTDTVVESGCVLDTHVLIGHDARVGAGSALAAYAAVAGGARLGQACRIGGKAAIGEGVVVADGVTVGAMSAVTASIERPGATYTGCWPAQPRQQWWRQVAGLRRHARLPHGGHMAER